MFEPSVAAEVLGIGYDYSDQLGAWGQGRDRFEIAGLVDRQQGQILVSTKFRYSVQRFTGAHEIAHVALDHPGRIMHRDRPIEGIRRFGRDALEAEADYFAACFLTPASLVKKAYQARFGSKHPLPLTDAVAYALCKESAHALMRAGADSYEFAAAVASATSFGSLRFESLTAIFGVSVGVMAIRLRELGLVED
jgi:Zn-dependent peptidase ImmA (M78 family)